jgi:outer membrane protein assembly factor BamA
MDKGLIRICLFTLLGILSFNVSVWAQNKRLQFQLAEGAANEKGYPERFPFSQNFRDSIDADIKIKRLKNSFVSKGYLEINIIRDTLSPGIYIVHPGPQYRWDKLTAADSISKILIYQTGFRYSNFENKQVKPSQVDYLFRKIITYAENNGYPFTQCEISNFETVDNSVSGKIKVTRGPIIKYDSVIVKGKAKIHPRFIQSYLGIKPGRIYNESRMAQAGKRLRELPYLREAQPYRTIFTKDYTKVLFVLDPVKANQFDGFLGFLPDDQTGKLNITGQARIKLLNPLGRGEMLDVDWRRLQLNTRDLKTKMQLPYLLSTPAGFEFNFKLFQRDTIFIDVNQNFNLLYSFTGNNAIRFFYSRRNTSLVSSRGYEFVTRLPDFADVGVNSYGIGLRLEDTDYRLTPTRGYRMNVSGSTGIREIRINPGINPAAYTNIELKSTQYSLDFMGEYYLKLLSRTILAATARSGALLGQAVLSNESYRIGGLQTLRGFDEESIYASSFFIGNAELRYLIEQNSYLFAFYNQAWYENRTLNNYVRDTPLGFGLGISFETRPGIFSLTYALGKQFENPIFLRSAKVHFGIVSSF